MGPKSPSFILDSQVAQASHRKCSEASTKLSCRKASRIMWLWVLISATLGMFSFLPRGLSSIFFLVFGIPLHKAGSGLLEHLRSLWAHLVEIFVFRDRLLSETTSFLLRLIFAGFIIMTFTYSFSFDLSICYSSIFSHQELKFDVNAWNQMHSISGKTFLFEAGSSFLVLHPLHDYERDNGNPRKKLNICKQLQLPKFLSMEISPSKQRNSCSHFLRAKSVAWHVTPGFFPLDFPLPRS